MVSNQSKLPTIKELMEFLYSIHKGEGLLFDLCIPPFTLRERTGGIRNWFFNTIRKHMGQDSPYSIGRSVAVELHRKVRIVMNQHFCRG